MAGPDRAGGVYRGPACLQLAGTPGPVWGGAHRESGWRHWHEQLLINDDWQIRNMATAHGAFVIEVEAEDPSQVETIARALIEPIKADYNEILVYVSRVGDPSDLPARRMQWTPQDGYVEIAARLWAPTQNDEIMRKGRVSTGSPQEHSCPGDDAVRASH